MLRVVVKTVIALAAAALLLGGASTAAANEKLRVVVPDRDNLQFMAFWVAKAGGFFEREGIDIELVVAPAPMQAEGMFERGEGDAAVLPPPMYLRLIAARRPIVLVANLLRNDPIDVVLRRESQTRAASGVPCRSASGSRACAA